MANLGQEDEDQEDEALRQMKVELAQFRANEARIAEPQRPMPYGSDSFHHRLQLDAQATYVGPRTVVSIIKSSQGQH